MRCCRGVDFDEAPQVFITPIARSPMTPALNPKPMLPPPSASVPQRQLSLTFETPVLQGMDPGQYANAITRLAILLLQAAGVRLTGAADDER